MTIHDLWLSSTKQDKNGKRARTARYGRGKRWRVSWQDPITLRTKTEAFARYEDAKDYNATVNADISRGTYIDPQAGRVKFSEYVESWRAIQLHQPGTVVNVEIAMRLHVYPHLGHIPMNQIVSKNIRAWVKSRESVLAPTSIHTIYSYLKSIFNTAVSDRVISVSPCTRIRLPEIERNKYWIPSPRQVAELHKAMNERYRAAVYIAAGCGLRLCEIFGLERDDIDFERREIHVRQQIKRVRGEVYVGPPKTKTSKRTVELPRVVERVLIEHLENFPSTPVKMRENNGKNKRVRSFDLVFTSARGQAVTGGHWGGPWRAARASVAGVPDNFGIHGLRHYFATLLIHCGASVKTVQAALGHASPITTLNVYAHEWPEAVDRTRNLVDSALGEDFELDQPIADNAQPGELTADVQVA